MNKKDYELLAQALREAAADSKSKLSILDKLFACDYLQVDWTARKNSDKSKGEK